MNQKLLVTLVASLMTVAMLTPVYGQNTNQPQPPMARQGRQLSAEEWSARRQVMQEYVAELRAKKASGTLTEAEASRLDRLEKMGGLCINGVPRGPGMGRGRGACWAAGGFSGKGGKGGYGGSGRGLRNATGPRAQDGTCPLLAPPAK